MSPTEQVDRLTIAVQGTRDVSGLLQLPANAFACYVLAHGAGAGMTHPFMATIANGFGKRGIGTLRYQFPYMEAGSRRPDEPALAHATVRAAVGKATELVRGLPIVAGGKSFGGRMTSQAQAGSPLPGVRGLVFLGFPLHPARKPSSGRAAHLSQIDIPMLFVQGTRDALADLGLLAPLVQRLGAGATLKTIDQADHAFQRRGSPSATGTAVIDEMLDAAGEWIRLLVNQGEAAAQASG